MLVANLPPDTATVQLARAHDHDDAAAHNTTPRHDQRHLTPVRNLQAVPVVSPGQAMRFVNSSPDEFCALADNEAS